MGLVRQEVVNVMLQQGFFNIFIFTSTFWLGDHDKFVSPKKINVYPCIDANVTACSRLHEQRKEILSSAVLNDCNLVRMPTLLYSEESRQTTDSKREAR